MFTNQNLTTVIRRFFADPAGCRIEPFGTGLINDTYCVHLQGEGQAWLLQRINHFVFRRPEVVMENIRRIADYLTTESYHAVILEPVPTLDGQLLYRDEAGNFWRLFPFFANTFSIDQATDPVQVRQAGRAFGEFSRALVGLDPVSAGIGDTIPGFHDSLSRLAFFEEVLAADPAGRVAVAADEIGAIKAYQGLFSEIAALDLPLRITHNDTKINNVLFDRDSGAVRGVVDWDTIMPGTILSDFGDMVRTMTPNYDENHRDTSEIDVVLPFFEALCAGFLPPVRAVLEPIELNNLVRGGQWITLEQALRFLTDYLNGDIYYKTTYPEQNLLRVRNQIALFRALLREEQVLERMVEQWASE